MKAYYKESSRKMYKITEDGKLFSKFKNRPKSKYKLQDNSANQVKFGNNKYCDRKIFYYQTYYDCVVKENERVTFINKYGDYSKDNLRLEIKTNPIVYFKADNRKILHYDAKNNLLNVFDSQYHASKTLKITQSGISASLIRKIRQRIGGEYFIYEGEPLRPLPEKVILKSNIKNDIHIYQYDLSGKLLNSFDTVKTAVDYLNLKDDAGSHIVKCCRMKRPTAYGYIWKYAETRKKKRLNKWVCYYVNNSPVHITSTRKEMCNYLNYNKSQISNVISGKVTPKKYTIKEVSYETGVDIKKLLEKCEN